MKYTGTTTTNLNNNNINNNHQILNEKPTIAANRYDSSNIPQQLSQNHLSPYHPSHSHHTHSHTSSSPVLNTASPTTQPSNAPMLVHNHHLLYHPQHPNDWYAAPAPNPHDSMHLNHFSHHHHHLVHHGPTPAY